MSQPVIQVEALSKQYVIGERTQYTSLRHLLGDALKAPLRMFRANSPASSNHRPRHIWALKDVSFQVEEGEVLGLIGRNGAGKSTLLKILARITRPTSGHAEIHGRVGSLLEVGTGFHPELTGRENVYLSGAVLGMKRKEIDRKFDEIVAFSEVEQFIDTPLKHFSTGMQMRLAFAVAAHLEPEILLVDEVLAVGDINFQKKCVGKMGDVAQAGRTVILVSHQLTPIRQLCHNVIWLDAGKIHEYGPSAATVNTYEANARATDKIEEVRSDSARAEFLRWEMEGAKNGQTNVLDWDGEVRLKFLVRVNQRLSNVHHGIALYNQSRQVLWGNGVDDVSLEPGLHELICAIPSLPLQPGVYHWRVSLYDNGERIDDWDCMPPMLVSTAPRTHRRDEFAGILNIPSAFTKRCAHVGSDRKN